MKPILVAMFALAVFATGCGKRPTQQSEPEKTPAPRPGDLTQKPQPKPSDPEPKNSPDNLNDLAPWVAYTDPAFTALFPSQSQAPKRDSFWEKQTIASSGIKGVRVVVSSALDWNCKVTVYPTAPHPAEFTKNPGAELDKYIPFDRTKHSVKELTLDGKFPARQGIAPGQSGGMQVYRIFYAYKRLYVVELSALRIESDDDADVKKFLESVRPKQ